MKPTKHQMSVYEFELGKALKKVEQLGQELALLDEVSSSLKGKQLGVLRRVEKKLKEKYDYTQRVRDNHQFEVAWEKGFEAPLLTALERVLDFYGNLADCQEFKACIEQLEKLCDKACSQRYDAQKLPGSFCEMAEEANHMHLAAPKEFTLVSPYYPETSYREKMAGYILEKALKAARPAPEEQPRKRFEGMYELAASIRFLRTSLDLREAVLGGNLKAIQKVDHNNLFSAVEDCQDRAKDYLAELIDEGRYDFNKALFKADQQKAKLLASTSSAPFKRPRSRL